MTVRKSSSITVQHYAKRKIDCPLFARVSFDGDVFSRPYKFNYIKGNTWHKARAIPCEEYQIKTMRIALTFSKKGLMAEGGMVIEFKERGII